MVSRQEGTPAACISMLSYTWEDSPHYMSLGLCGLRATDWRDKLCDADRPRGGSIAKSCEMEQRTDFLAPSRCRAEFAIPSRQNRSVWPGNTFQEAENSFQCFPENALSIWLHKRFPVRP